MICYSISGIAYESCNGPEPWENTMLLSPEMNLATDSLLKFNLSTERRGLLEVYATSQVGHISFRIATFAPTTEAIYNETLFNMTYGGDMGMGNITSMNFAAMSICVPRNTEKLAFVASAMFMKDIFLIQPDVVIKDILLTDTPCTALTLPGKQVIYLLLTHRVHTILVIFY